MIRSVAKHSYIRGRNGKVRASKHVNYIAYRGGEEREERGRKFFDKEREDIDAREIKQCIYEEQNERGVTMHKLILSPGVDDVDVKEYTREIMEKLSQEKRLELDWQAVVHENTRHHHAHVVIMGKDKNGHAVRFDRDDHKHIREWGDGYLDREHKLERYLDREIQDLIKEKGWERPGAEDFKRLFWGPDREDDREREGRGEKELRAVREYYQLDEEFKKWLKESGDLYRVKGSQRQLEQAGRLSEYHGDYSAAMGKKRLEELAEQRPDLAESIKQELEYFREIAQENRGDQMRSLEQILGFDQQSQIERQPEPIRTEVMGGKTDPAEQEQERDRGDDVERGGLP